MDKYKAFLDFSRQLESRVSDMSTVTTRKEVEALEMETKKLFGKMMTKLPYVQREIHNYALEQAKRVSEADLKATFGE